MPVTFPPRAPVYTFERRWYQKPHFYIPIAGVLVLLFALVIYGFILASDCSRQAETYDLNELEKMESASVIVDRNDKIFGQIYVENRETVPYDQLPRDLVNAVVAIEDNKFYQHSGYDLFGILRAAVRNATAGGVRQGASTVTQQLARNSFALKERTFRRKIVEVFLARRIEDHYGKQKIMELYLNRIYFGGGCYGAEAAARGYFGKPAREMTVAECATLAGLIKSPNRLSPWTDPEGSRDTRNVVLTRMRDLGFISAERCNAAQAEKMVVGNRQNSKGQTYAVDYIRQQVIAAVGWDKAMNEGYRIRTTIDADMQKAAEASLRANLDKAEQAPGYNHDTYAAYTARLKAARQNAPATQPPVPEYLQGAVIALNNQTGGILALVGGRDFEQNQFDRAIQARRPAGTAMTPFVYAAAFEKGLYPGTVVDDSALDNRAVMIGGTTGILGEWGPERADNRYEGAITAREALVKSKNGATVRLGMQAGVDSVVQLCKTAGIKSPLRPYPATFLGSSEVTLAELAVAYTAFPNSGSRAGGAFILERIEDKTGKPVWESKRDRSKQAVMKPESAYEVHSCLVDALATGTGAAAYSKFGLQKFPAAGKTGTAYDFTDALFAGYTSDVTCAVWAGFDKPQKIYRGAFGSEIALPVWVDIMNAANAHYPAKEIAKPATLQSVEICSKSGLLATDKCINTTYRELATKEQMPTEPCNVHGDVRARLVRDLPDAGVPRAALAVDTAQMKPVGARGPILLADKDPYGAVKSTAKPPPVPEEAKPLNPVVEAPKKAQRVDPTLTAPDEPGVLRAQPVAPGDDATVDALPAEPVLRAQPVNPRERQRPRRVPDQRDQSTDPLAEEPRTGRR
ncbi:MAG: PBP1A family penicillin-binding protein [Chthoniobacterales bacterium]